MSHLRPRRGSMLVQVLVAGGVLVTLVFGLVSVLSQTARGWSADSSAIFADTDASLGLQKLAREVRTGIRASTDTSGTALTLVLPKLTAEGNFDRFQDGDTVQFYLQNEVLYRQQGSGAATVLARNVDALRFGVSGAEVNVGLTSRQRMGVREGQTVLQTAVALRNQIRSF